MLGRTLTRILKLAGGLIQSSVGSVLLHDKRRNDLYFASAIGPVAPNLFDIRVPINGSIAGDVFRTGTPVVEDHLSKHYEKVDATTKFTTRSMVCVPLDYADQRQGVMQILNKADGSEPYTPRDLELLTRFTRPATIAIARAQMFEQLLGSCGLHGEPAIRQDIVDQMFAPEPFAMCERLSILSVDIRGFSRLCSAINKPLKIQQWLGEYVAMASSLIVKHQGILNKVMGDGVVWLCRGPAGAARAAAAALDVVDHFVPLREQWAEQVNTNIEFVDIGVGLATAEDMVLGSVGDETFRDVTVIGEAVNLAALLVKAARDGRRILCDRVTHGSIRSSSLVQIAGPWCLSTDKNAVVTSSTASSNLAYYVYTLSRPAFVPTAGRKSATGTSFDLFISYRRQGSSGEARGIEQALKNDYRIFLDVDSMPSGHFDEAILRVIEAAPNFLVVLSPGSLDRIHIPNDWLRREIEHAIKTGRNIIPVMLPGFVFPDDSALPTEICDLKRWEAVEYSHVYFPSVIARVRSHLKPPQSV